MAFQLPISALLAQALSAFTTEFDRAVASAGFPDLSLALGSNVLRFLDEEHGIRSSMIASLAGVSKQAVSQQVVYLAEHGYVTITPDPADSRAKLVRLTKMGRRSQEVCRPIFGSIEQRWKRHYGRDEMRSLRTSLEAVVAQLDGTLPHYPVR